MGAVGAAGAAIALLACGGAAPGQRSELRLPADAVPVAVGVSRRYRPGPWSAAVSRGATVAGLRCEAAGPRPRTGVLVELFARRRLILVPAGIGVAPPVRRRGAYVEAGRCSYPLRTTEATGLVQVDLRRRLRLGQLFALWGQPLGATRLAGFRAPAGQRVRASVAGRPWPGDPRSIPLRRHAVIVLEIDGFLPAHSAYRFPPGL